MRFAVKFTPEAEAQLSALYDYVANAATPVTAERYTTAIIEHCEALSAFPTRAPARDDIRPGLRVTHHRGRTVIAYSVDDDAKVVWILGVYYGGQDFASFLRTDD